MPFAVVLHGSTVVLLPLQIIREIIQLYLCRCKYLKDWENYFEFGLYTSTILFVLPYFMCLVGEETNTVLFYDLKWQAGAICVLFLWCDVLLHYKRIPLVGLYMVMFVEVLKTLFNVLFVFFIMIVGFALSFYALLSDQASFSMPGRAIVKTTIMMIR